MQPQHQMYPVRHSPGLQLNKLTAAGSHGQDHLMITGTQDEDLLHSSAPKMNNLVVPFSYDSLANNTTKGLQNDR